MDSIFSILSNEEAQSISGGGTVQYIFVDGEVRIVYID